MDLVDPGSWVTGNVDGSCGSWILNFVFVFGSCGSWILEFRSRPSLVLCPFVIGSWYWIIAVLWPVGISSSGPRDSDDSGPVSCSRVPVGVVNNNIAVLPMSSFP